MRRVDHSAVLIRRVHKYTIIIRDNLFYGNGGNFEYTLVRGRRKIYDPTSFMDPYSDLRYAKHLAFILSHPSLFIKRYKVKEHQYAHKRGFCPRVKHRHAEGHLEYGGALFSDGQLYWSHLKRRSKLRQVTRFFETM